MDYIIRAYRFLFARTCFYRLNRLLYRCSLNGLGILNYESDWLTGEKTFLRNFLRDKNGAVVFDVGANIGEFSMRVLELDPQATLYAFEPHPQTFAKLIARVRGRNFHPVNAAVGSSSGKLSLYDYEHDDGSSHASLYRDVIENIHHAKSVSHEVEVISLQDFLQNQGITHIDLLKIDTEGNEFDVLKGLRRWLDQKRISAIHFEFNEMNVSSRVFFRDFWDLLTNYTLYRLLPDGMAKIATYNPLFCEIFAYQNIVAILNEQSA